MNPNRSLARYHFPVILRVTLALTLLMLTHRVSSQEFPLTPVFQAKQDGYNVYRIPAVIQAKNGDLLAFCEAREGGDASQIDLVMKRSTDGGGTWGKLQVVKGHAGFSDAYPEGTAITVGNPAPVVDLLDPIHPGRTWLPFTVENDRVFVTFSDDHGDSWSNSREITADVKLEKWGWYATGPVHSIQLQHGSHRGRLVVPADHRIGDNGADRGPEGAQAFFSDDHGQTWQLGAVDASYRDGLNANETAVVELNDGRLYFTTRDQNGDAPGARGSCISLDGGQTFVALQNSEFQFFRPDSEPLDPPVVQCSIVRALSTKLGDARDLILFSGPDENGPSGKGRSDMRIRFSTDETQSWNEGPLVYTGPAAYSDMVRISESTVGILFECGVKGAYEQIAFAKIKIADIR